MLAVFPEGRWWEMNGEPGKGELRIELVGEPLPMRDPTRVAIHGRQEIAGTRTWTVVQVPAADNVTP